MSILCPWREKPVGPIVNYTIFYFESKYFIGVLYVSKNPDYGTPAGLIIKNMDIQN